MAETSAGLLTSATIAVASPPPLMISSAVSLTPSAARSATATRAPSRANKSAVPRPMPRAAPVMRATFPSSMPAMTHSSLLFGAFLEDVLRRGNRRQGVRPAGIEGQMRDDLGDLARLHTVIERKLELMRQLDRLVARDQRRQGDDAAVARRQSGAPPQVGERALRVFLED